MVKCEFLQHVLCKTFTFEVFWGASKHPSEGTFLNASQSKPLLFSRVVKIAELSVAKASEQWFCVEGFIPESLAEGSYPSGVGGSPAAACLWRVI